MKKSVLVLALSALMLSPLYAGEGQDQANKGKAQSKSGAVEGASEAKYCPICGPEEEMEELSFSYKHEGKKYHFCSLDCLKAFKKNPQKYIDKGTTNTPHP